MKLSPLLLLPLFLIGCGEAAPSAEQQQTALQSHRETLAPIEDRIKNVQNDPKLSEAEKQAIIKKMQDAQAKGGAAPQ